MATKRRLVDDLKDALAFIVCLAVGITFGCFYAAVEAVEDKLKTSRRQTIKHVGDGR